MDKREIEPVKVTCFGDIQRVISKFNEGSNDKTKISTEVSYEQDGKTIREIVEAEVHNTSPRAMLVEGLNVVKSRMEFQAVSKELHGQIESSHWKSENLFDIDINKAFFWVDSLIKNRLGGVRHDLCVRWIIKDGLYEWDPFTGELRKIEC